MVIALIFITYIYTKPLPWDFLFFSFLFLSRNYLSVHSRKRKGEKIED